MRRNTKNVKIGELELSSEHPIVIQSMLNTSSSDTEACIQQAIRIINAGGQLVRITVPRVKDAENLQTITSRLQELGYNIPLSADIHFLPEAAYIAAKYVDKVRINPGNFVDKRADFKARTYTDEQYTKELEHIKEKFITFLNICRENNTAIRIGTNHGSLSDRIMNRYGNTAEGMVEATMEYLRICAEEHYDNVVVSLKSSDCRIMVKAVRLIASRMDKEGLNYPLHLGVTEAGEGEDGRIRSAIGIGCLLNEGIGDTIRVSLTEAPEKEIPVCKNLLKICANPRNKTQVLKERCHKPQIIANEHNFITDNENTPELIFIHTLNYDFSKVPNTTRILVPACLYHHTLEHNLNIGIIYSTYEFINSKINHNKHIYITFKSVDELNNIQIEKLKAHNNASLILALELDSNTYREFYKKMDELNLDNTTIIYVEHKGTNKDDINLEIAAHVGGLFLDLLPSGLWIETTNISDMNYSLTLSKNILQSAGLRRYKTEFISCPGCGRTLFDLEGTVAKVKHHFGNLVGLKIAVMGCVVNGPGEMGDADYGYIGGANGKINLYKDGKLVRSGVPETEAIDTLKTLIKETSS